MWSDGESDQASGTSSDEVQSPVRVRMRNLQQRISNEVMRVQSEVSNTHSNTHVEPKLYIKLSKCCVSSIFPECPNAWFLSAKGGYAHICSQHTIMKSNFLTIVCEFAKPAECRSASRYTTPLWHETTYHRKTFSCLPDKQIPYCLSMLFFSFLLVSEMPNQIKEKGSGAGCDFRIVPYI